MKLFILFNINMKNYFLSKGSIPSQFNQSKHVQSSFMSFMKFTSWNITLFSLLPLATAFIIDEEYKPEGDVYDAILNTLFPVFFVILFSVKGKTGPIKNVMLPLLDDTLYNTVTWVIPLLVSFAY